MIEHWSEGVADFNMAEEILVDLAETIRRHPWWQARAALTLALLKTLQVAPPARVLDAGCGWGVTLDALEKQGYQATGMDVSRRTLEQLDRPDRNLVEADLTRPIDREVKPFDAVLALDVIEHIDDDRAAVARLGCLARPGGIVIVSVPALPEMYTEFDRIQGHRRRYRPETLRAAFDGSGLALEQIFWWGQWLVPALRRQRAEFRLAPASLPRRPISTTSNFLPGPCPGLPGWRSDTNKDGRFGASFEQARRCSRSRGVGKPEIRSIGTLD